MSSMTNQTGPTQRFLADRLDRLQQTIDGLGQRLRLGLARAVGQTVSEAVHAAVRGLLTGAPLPTTPPEPLLDSDYDPYGQYPAERYQPLADDPYAEARSWDRPYDPEPAYTAPPAPATPPVEPSTRWRLALAASMQALSFWLRDRSGRKTILTAVGVAAATGAAAYAAGPLLASGAAVVGAAVSLLGLTDGTKLWVNRLLQATAL